MAASGSSAPSRASDRFLVFRARDRTCVIDLGSAVETMRVLPIEPIPTAPAWVLGASVVRGAPIPVLDVAGLLEPSARPAADAASPDARFVVVRVKNRTVALFVDAVLGVTDLVKEDFRAMPPLLRSALPDVVAAMTSADADLMLVLESARLVSDEVARSLGEST